MPTFRRDRRSAAGAAAGAAGGASGGLDGGGRDTTAAALAAAAGAADGGDASTAAADADARTGSGAAAAAVARQSGALRCERAAAAGLRDARRAGTGSAAGRRRPPQQVVRAVRVQNVVVGPEAEQLGEAVAHPRDHLRRRRVDRGRVRQRQAQLEPEGRADRERVLRGELGARRSHALAAAQIVDVAADEGGRDAVQGRGRSACGRHFWEFTPPPQ